MLPDGVLKYPAGARPVGALPGFPCFHGPAVKRLPFQRQTRDREPPLGSQRLSPERNTGPVSWSSEPTAASGGSRNTPGCGSMRLHSPPARRKTAQPWTGQHMGAVKVTAIASLPGPANDPQSTCATGVRTSFPQTKKRLATTSAVALEQPPGAVDAVGEAAAT